ncbi:syntaxin 1B/2/3 [Angomonas deanei]|nr:syntaxin 1B/2/3 [Angomonas deanei]|eukprot:EPY29387.1 syntaxin 1B/2/3 [Angomonas deanei]
METNSLFQQLFEEQRAKSTNADGPTVAENMALAKKALQHPLYDTTRMIHKTCRSTIRECSSQIVKTLQVLDTCPHSTTKVESRLLLCEANLLSCSTALKELIPTIAKAQEQEVMASASSDKRSEEIRENNRNVGEGGQVLLPIHVLNHFEQQLVSLQSLVADCRLKVVLCKEEVALYKNEMVYFRNAGVLSCEEDPTAGYAEPSSGEQHDMLRNVIEKRNEMIDVLVGTAPNLIGDVSKQTFSLVDNVVKRAAETVKAAGAQADQLFVKAIETGKNSTEALLHKGVPSALRQGTIASAKEEEDSSPFFTFTEEETAVLEKENLALVKQHEEALSLDAKLIEASVRELSQLTSLANEQVVIQNEQFSIALQNTEKVQSNMDKALKEMKKTEAMFWTNKKQLIALLWMCTIVLLVSNLIIR